MEAGWNVLANVSSKKNVFNQIYSSLNSRDSNTDIEEYGNGKTAERDLR